MSLIYLSGENYSYDLYDKRHENRLYMNEPLKGRSLLWINGLLTIFQGVHITYLMDVKKSR